MNPSRLSDEELNIEVARLVYREMGYEDKLEIKHSMEYGRKMPHWCGDARDWLDNWLCAGELMTENGINLISPIKGFPAKAYYSVYSAKSENPMRAICEVYLKIKARNNIADSINVDNENGTSTEIVLLAD